MTEQLYLEDAYRKSAPGQVVGHTEEGGIILDRTIFYARGGGQPGDSGTLDWSGGRIAIATAVKGEERRDCPVPAEPGGLPPVGTDVDQRLDWDRRLGTCASTRRCIFCRWSSLARHRRCRWGGEGAARLRHARGAAGSRGAGGAAERAGHARPAGVGDVDQR
jgi:hypothetical protein